jgi:hypothetical protein
MVLYYYGIMVLYYYGIIGFDIFNFFISFSLSRLFYY